MKRNAVFFAVILLALTPTALLAQRGNGGGGGGGGGNHIETAGNNLSYPVLWSDGVPKVVPECSPDPIVLTGEWWYWWGTDAADMPLSCSPDPDDMSLCDDGIPSQATGAPPGDGFVRAYLQKDYGNCWTAGRSDESAAEFFVHWIDWGDNLESVDWYTRSQVRTEVVLFQDLAEPMLEYEMRHTSGWGIDEVHGLAALPGNPPVALEGPGLRATVYSHCARLTIQKLLVDRDDPRLVDLIWEPGDGWTEPEGYETPLINPHIFNGSVHEGGDGPGYYSAEINVKGRIIYGYTWNVRNLNDNTGGTAAGDYRITFSLDEVCGTAPLNTSLAAATIMIPLEEELAAAAEADDDGSDTGGAVGVLVPPLNLTYMDVRILERGGGGKGGNGGRR